MYFKFNEMENSLKSFVEGLKKYDQTTNQVSTRLEKMVKRIDFFKKQKAYRRA